MNETQVNLQEPILLVRVTGEDRPGLTSRLTKVLARHGAEILDINQAVIHRQLLLGLLIRMPQGIEPAPVLGELVVLAGELGLQLRTRPVPAEEYDAWVGRQGKARHILTLLARSISAEQISQVSRLCVEQGLNIDVITRLSGRPPRRDDGGPRRACVELSLRGEPEDADAMHGVFLELSRDLDMDLAWQRDDIYRRTRRLVAFDMDSTLIQAEVIDELAKEAGAGEEVAAVTEQAMRGEIDFDESLRRRVAALKGLDESTLHTVAERLVLTEGAQRLIHNLRSFGFKTAIISGGFTYFGEHLKEKLEIDYVCANELEIEDGKLTGRVVGEIVNGERKAELLKRIAEEEQIDLRQVVAIGDGANDLPMLNQAGLGVAFHAKPIVQETADHQISTLGLDGALYLMGMRDRDLAHPAVSGPEAPPGSAVVGA